MAVDMFLKIDGIPGESTDSKHKGEIDILNWSWGATNHGTMALGGGGGAGKVAMNDVRFTKYVDKASPKLMEACASGEHIKKPTVLVVRKAGKEQQEYLTITLTDILVASYDTGAGHGDDRLTENFTLNFAQIQIEYKEQKEDGTLGGAIKAGWSVKENKKV